MRSYGAGAPKRSMNLAVNSDLVARARAEGLDLSALAEVPPGCSVYQTARMLHQWSPRGMSLRWNSGLVHRPATPSQTSRAE
jgi:Post-segregation antitoxin CcdA